MKKVLAAIFATAVLMTVSSGAFAEKSDFGHKMTPEMKAKMEQKKAEFEKRLNLTQEQKEKIKSMHEASREKIHPLLDSLKTERQKMKQLRDSEASAQEKLAQREKIKTILTQMKTIRESNFSQVQAILTPEQQKEFNKMKEEREQNIKGKLKEFKRDRMIEDEE